MAIFLVTLTFPIAIVLPKKYHYSAAEINKTSCTFVPECESSELWIVSKCLNANRRRCLDKRNNLLACQEVS